VPLLARHGSTVDNRTEGEHGLRIDYDEMSSLFFVIYDKSSSQATMRQLLNVCITGEADGQGANNVNK
jgi:hypothetical protein